MLSAGAPKNRDSGLFCARLKTFSFNLKESCDLPGESDEVLAKATHVLQSLRLQRGEKPGKNGRNNTKKR